MNKIEEFKQIKKLIKGLEAKGDNRTQGEDELLEELRLVMLTRNKVIHFKESAGPDPEKCPVCGK